MSKSAKKKKRKNSAYTEAKRALEAQNGSSGKKRGTGKSKKDSSAAIKNNGRKQEKGKKETAKSGEKRKKQEEACSTESSEESDIQQQTDEPASETAAGAGSVEAVRGKTPGVPAVLVCIVSLLVWEVLFKTLTVRNPDPQGWLLTGGYCIVFGTLIGTAITLLGEKAGRWVLAAAETAGFAVYTGQYVHYLFYSSFFSLFSLMSGTGQVAQFADSILRVMMKHFFSILLLLLPAALSIILAFSKKMSFRMSVAAGAVCVVLAAAVFFCIPAALNKEDGRMYSPYNIYHEINSPFYSVRYFGLGETMVIDAYRYLTGFEEKTVIVAPSAVQQDDNGDVEYNVTDVDFASLADSESRDTIADMHRYFATARPTEKNDYTGIFEGKNLIYIVAEALCYGAIDPEITPTLYKMASEGINFTNYYSPLYYASTFDGEYMTLLSLIPRDGEWSLYTARNNDLPYSYGNAFRKIGYRSEAYHGWWYDYYYRDETHPNLGYGWNAVGSGLDVNAGYWPPSDVEVVEKSVPEYISDSPFMVYYLSISGHLGYTFSGNTMASKHRDEVADLPYTEPVRAYYACQKEFDDSLSLLLSDLEAEGILDDTVIVISNDHYPYGLLNDELREFCDYIEDEKFDIHKGVFLIYNSATEGRQVDTVCSSLDALPTVSNMFSLEFDSRLVMGTDVMSGQEPVVILSDRSWKTSSGTYDASEDTFHKARLAEIGQNYVDEMNQKVYYKFLMSRYILEYDYYSLIN